MRILGFSQRWDKLQNCEFTTFRFIRRDADWRVGELLQVVYKPQSKEREVLGTARIVAKELRRIDLNDISNAEAKADGFKSASDMVEWFSKTYNHWQEIEPVNKLTLAWVTSSQINVALAG